MLLLVPMNALVAEDNQYDEAQSFIEFRCIMLFESEEFFEEYGIEYGIPVHMNPNHPYSIGFSTIISMSFINDDGVVEFIDVEDIRILGAGTIVEASLSPARCVHLHGWPTSLFFNDDVFVANGQPILNSAWMTAIAWCRFCGSEALFSGFVNRVVGAQMRVTPTGVWVPYTGTIFIERQLRFEDGGCCD